MAFRSLRNAHTVVSFAIASVAIVGLLSPVGSIANGAAVPSGDEGHYHIIDRQHVDGELKWDYLSMDGDRRHLFITHGDRVEVYDVDQKKMIGAILDTPGVHGVAVASDLDRGFTSNGKGNSVTIFALSTLKIIGTAATEKKPDGIVYDALSKRVFAMNGGSDSMTPIDASAGKSFAAIALGGKPEFLAVDGKGHLFVNLEDKNQIVVIDTKNLEIIQRIDLSATCDEPAGLSIDLATQRLFVGCHNQKMVVVDGKSGKVMDSVPIGSGSDATAFDATARLAFSSNDDGTLNIFSARDATHYQLKQTVNTMRGARTMAIDPVSHKIYVLSAETDPTMKPTQKKSASRPRFVPNTLTLVTVSP
ncbi:YncE family protein [Glaciimonas sp. PAMC28666]|uniref:YncE family protein n=1 Tax=Glaciimonas sp. PAMC28666 TaxID=2807626 RepID=UPI0019667530|nr:hypothetical protein [Glaciimonas sp. PAMC28666]QRX83088.1 hypothetical protein JQN73_02000 [Glaciimonas sp. PAMC28666]